MIWKGKTRETVKTGKPGDSKYRVSFGGEGARGGICPRLDPKCPPWDLKSLHFCLHCGSHRPSLTLQRLHFAPLARMSG